MKKLHSLILAVCLLPAAFTHSSAQWSLTGNAGTNPSVNFVGTTDAQSLVMRTNSVEALRINTGQLIGIGTATPAYKIHLLNATNARSLHLENTSSLNSTKYGVYNTVNNSGTGGRYGIYNSSTSSSESAATNYGIYNTVTHPGSGIAYGLYTTVSTSGTGTHYGVYSSSSGSSNYSFYGIGRGYFSDKVGLGITAPVGQLHIKDVEVDLSSGGSLVLGATTAVNMAFDANEIHVRDNGSSGMLYLNPLGGSVSINNAGTVEDVSLSGNGAFRIGDNSSTNLVFDNNEIQARTDGAANTLGLNVEGGNVCIGTWSGSERLNVCGGIKATEIRVESGWCDYVFEENYPLRPLQDEEVFSLLNKHLPNIPPASEVESSGLSLGDMSKRMMEKIEELTLYVIEQDKQIRRLQEENERIHQLMQPPVSR